MEPNPTLAGETQAVEDSAPVTDWAAMTAHELALRFDCSAAWLLRGECFEGPHIGAGGYLAAATKLRQQENEIERLRASSGPTSDGVEA
jgi:hypothetical protein